MNFVFSLPLIGAPAEAKPENPSPDNPAAPGVKEKKQKKDHEKGKGHER